MGEIQAPHKSHKTKELVSRHCFSLCFGSKSDQSSGSDFNLQILLQWPGFQFQGEKKAKYCTKNIATRNQICHMTFSSPELKGHSLSLSLTHTQIHADRKALTCTRSDADTKYAPVVSQKVHTDTHAQ